MHPLIAFLSFLFSPSEDWLAKSGFTLFINPYDVPAIVEQYQGFIKHYPAESKKEQKITPASLDALTMATWGEILFQTNHTEEALRLWQTVVKRISDKSP